MGAGDLVKENLEAIGLTINTIDIERITQEELNEYDTILVGIRAFNVLESLQYKNQLLFDFAAQGGNLIVQYNTSRRLQTKAILPYTIQLSRDRVTDESSRVRILEPQHPAMQFPHKITAQDFDLAGCKNADCILPTIGTQNTPPSWNERRRRSRKVWKPLGCKSR